MFKNKSKDGKLNLCGTAITRLRKEHGLSQRELADQLQLLGLDLNKNAIQQIESGQRFVTDIELDIFVDFFKVTADKMLKDIE